MIIDYTKEDGMCFIKLIELEAKRQNRSAEKLKVVQAKLLCDCCNKPFVKWLDDIDQRGMAYVTGLQGWWTGKVGIEKSPEYTFMVGTPLLDFTPGELYHIIAGSIDGHCFIFANGQLLLEAMDPDPIDNQKFTKVGLEAYCSLIRVRNFKIRQIVWKPVEMKYEPEF